MDRFWVVMALTVIIHLISTLSYSIRLSGIKTKRLLTAFSLYNVIYIVASFSSTIQIPLLTSMMEHGIKEAVTQAGGVVTGEQLVNYDVYRAQLVLLAERIRLVIIAATLGTGVGAALIPSFIRIFVRAINLFEETGSVVRVFIKLVFYNKSRRIHYPRLFLQPDSGSLRRVAGLKLTLPKNFLIINVLVTGLYTTGILSSIYAGALFPDFRSTASMLSAFVNGFATVLGAMVVEPTAASITDEAMRGDRDESDVRQMTFYLALTRLTGTIIAQVLFLPGAYLIRFMAGLLA